MTANPVITGLGVVAPTGIGVEAYWRATLAGTCALRPVSSFDAGRLPVGLVGEVDFDEAPYVSDLLRVQTDRWTWMAMAATQLALTDAGLDPGRHDPYALSVVTASASGGNEFGQREIHAMWGRGPRAVSAYQSIGWFYAASTGQISIKEQLKGGCGVIVADTAGGLDALASASRSLRHRAGGLRAIVVGGTEAALSPYALACQCVEGAFSRDLDPRTAFAPFSPTAPGRVPGEGGAMLVVEEAAFARERGAARVYAEVAGAAATHDAHSAVGLAGDHTQLARAVLLAIERAGCAPADISAVFADGWGEPAMDRVEADALESVFEGRPVPVTVPKTMVGRLGSGGAPLDVACAALALHSEVLPPTVNVSAPHPPGIDLITSPREAAGLDNLLVLARGAGGFNSAVVLRRAAA